VICITHFDFAWSPYWRYTFYEKLALRKKIAYYYLTFKCNSSVQFNDRAVTCEHLIDFDNNWYERYAVGVCPDAILAPNIITMLFVVMR